MKDILLEIIGDYVSVEGQTGVAALDWPFILSSILFISLICVTAWFACRLIAIAGTLKFINKNGIVFPFVQIIIQSIICRKGDK